MKKVEVIYLNNNQIKLFNFNSINTPILNFCTKTSLYVIQ